MDEKMKIVETIVPKKKKILFFVEAMGGGVFTYIVDLSNELCKKYDMYVAYGLRPQTPENYKDYFDKKVHLIYVPEYTRSINLANDFKSFFRMKKIADEIQPDIIHLHSSKSGVLGRWAFDGKKIPMFYTPHGYSFLMENYEWYQRWGYKVVEVLSARRRCITISCSYGENNETLKFTKNATYVNNGINIKKLQLLLDNIKVSEHQFTVYTLGRICYQKNPKLFNDIAERMPNVKFIWIGDGELRNILTSSNIEITGWKDREDALKISMNADVFLLTSLWEGLPMSLLESMYMRKLCVVSDVIGNHDVIKSGINGYVCNSIDDYVRAIKSMDKKLVDKAYDDVLCEYNTCIMAQKYSEIYENMQ